MTQEGSNEWYEMGMQKADLGVELYIYIFVALFVRSNHNQSYFRITSIVIEKKISNGTIFLMNDFIFVYSYLQSKTMNQPKYIIRTYVLTNTSQKYVQPFN